MKKKKVSLGIKYSIHNTEEHNLLKKINTDLLDFLNDAPNSHRNIYNGITHINLSKINNTGLKQIFQNYIIATSQFLGRPLPAILPLSLEISKLKQFTFKDYIITDFQYDINNQTLIIDTILIIEDLFLIDTYSNKLLVIELKDIVTYNNNNQVQIFTIEDSSDLLILQLN